MKRQIDLALAAVVGVASTLPLAAVLRADFLNWDDDAVFTGNAHLIGADAVEVVRWAFTTTQMGHYQPLSWLTWAGVARIAGLVPGPFHALSLATHTLVVALVYLTAVRLLSRRRAALPLPIPAVRAGAAIGALLFGVHPLRVEPVAWASAFPYLAALACALLSVQAYVASRTRASDSRPLGVIVGSNALSLTAIGLFAASLLFRPIALGLPLILLALDWFFVESARRAWAHNRAATLLANKIPYVGLAAAAAALEWAARRETGFATLAAGPRLTLVVKAPFAYLWRTIAPFRLSPVDVLPLDAAASRLAIASGLLGLAAICALTWRTRKTWPGLLLAWTSYLLLIAPAVGLGPSGLQATADRYAYLPGVAIAIATGGVCAAAASHAARRAAFTAASIVIVALGVLSWHQTRYWSDSIALWSRTAALDPHNDVATYNLGTALQSTGRLDEAAAAYEATLRLVADHVSAQLNLRGLKAMARQRQADALAQAGDLDAAIPLYREALAFDPARSRARANLGVALVQSNDVAAGLTEIETAVREGISDPDVVNVECYALVQLGRTDEAMARLRDAVAKYPGDTNLARNLALVSEQARGGTKK